MIECPGGASPTQGPTRDALITTLEPLLNSWNLLKRLQACESRVTLYFLKRIHDYTEANATTITMSDPKMFIWFLVSEIEENHTP